MAEVLVYVDHVDGAVRKPTLELLTLARRIGEPVAVALGAGAADTAAVLAEHGAVKVLTADAPEFTEYLVVPKVDALQAAYDIVSLGRRARPLLRRGQGDRRPPGAAHRLRHHHRRHRPRGR